MVFAECINSTLKPFEALLGETTDFYDPITKTKFLIE